jgi:signal transduction histidine kinase
VIGQWLQTHGRSFAVVGLGLTAAGVATFVTLVVRYDLDFLGPLGGPWVMAFATFAVTGALIAWNRPGHVIGPLFLLMGMVAPVGNSIQAMAMGPFAEHDLGLRTLIVAISLIPTTAVFPLMLMTIMLFPDGRLPSARWRWAWSTTALTIAVGVVAAFVSGSWGGDPDQVLLDPPFDGRFVAIAEVLSPIFFALVGALLIAATTAIVLRYRRGDALVRQQLKWFVLAMLILAIEAIALLFVDGWRNVSPGLNTVLVALGVAFVPVSAAIAILRHRLYDIDVVLNRAIVFGMLAVFITALYVAVVVGVGSLVGDPSNLALSIGTTALVAAAFEPVRARVQHLANVAVYGRRASPYEVLATIADELGAGASGEDPLETMAALLADGTGAAHATVWVDGDGGLSARACWPVHDPSEHPSIPGDDVARLPNVAHAEPVRLDEELLGALSLQRDRDEPVTPREQQLVAELAGQASLVLGNARLRDRLRDRLEELRRSRQRLVAIQDDTRRRLERDLHDGAQQQLVALKVKLGLARTIASKEGAGEATADRLAQVSAATDRAVDALRTLARGIYPPLLEAEGLERAISTQAQAAPVPATVRTRGLVRYGRQVEAAVYFCVLEALSNTLRHAEARTVEIVLDDDGARLAFTVTDDGRGLGSDARGAGLGLVNMADRLDALGGSLTLSEAPGGGARVHGEVPDPTRIEPVEVAGDTVTVDSPTG